MFLRKLLATAAIGFAALAIPATAAFASTSDYHPATHGYTADVQPNHGYDNYNQRLCLQDGGWKYLEGATRFDVLPYGGGDFLPYGPFCYPQPRPEPAPRCISLPITFNFPHGSSWLTEVGPWPFLHNGEQATYAGTRYTLENVTGSHFQVEAGWPAHTVTNGGPGIWHGVAHTVCPSVHFPR